jgi:membrane protease subunit HflK
MYPPGGPRQPEFDFDQVMAKIRTSLGPIGRRLGSGGVGLLVGGLIAIIVAIWLATGIYTVNPGEQAVTQRFGKVCGTPIGPCEVDGGLVTTTGLKWWWPGPIGKKRVFLVNQVRRMNLGFRSSEGTDAVPVPDESLMISGDLNMVDVRMVVQYDIQNLIEFLFRVDDPGEQAGVERTIPQGQPDGRTLKDAAEAALRLVVGQRSIGHVLAEERSQVEEATSERLQEILDDYHTGINIVGVELQEVQAPEEVRAAFSDVVQARQDKQTAINQAQAFENQVLPEARGQSAQIIQAADAFREARIQRAQGEADQFTAILIEFQKSEDVTRQRLYLEAMEDVLPGLSKIIVSPEVDPVLILGGQDGAVPIPIGPNPSP